MLDSQINFGSPLIGSEWSEDETASDEQAAPYSFVAAFAADHFVSAYIDYASQRTDAAHEYHESHAIALLAAATPNVRASLGPYPGGLGTNLFIKHIGDSTTSRKTSAKDTAQDVHERAMPGSVLADESTPEAMIEEIAGRPRQSSTMYVDELGELLIKMEQRPYMAGLKGLFLTLYGGNDYRKRRTAKRKEGQKSEDSDVIERPHLTIVGCTTPMVFERMAAADVLGGLMARFAIVWPTNKPARRPFFEVGPSLDRQRDGLVESLQRIHTWSTQSERSVRFGASTLERADLFAQQLEREAIASHDDATKVMLQRLMPMALKLAMLSAAGRRDGTSGYALRVTEADTDAALVVAERWRRYAHAFALHVGQTDFERRARRCLAVLDAKDGYIPRREIAKRAHMEKRQLDMIEETLIDRGAIRVEMEPSASGPATKSWVRVRT